MNLDAELKDGLETAMCEATLLGAEVETEERIAGVTLEVLTLPEKGSPPSDRRVQFLLSPVGRVAASLRPGRPNDTGASFEKFEVKDLLPIVEGFKCPVYGSGLFDQGEKEFASWGLRVSLDWRSGSDGLSHSLCLFQEGGSGRHLDFCIWFDELVIKDPKGRPIAFEDFVSGGLRWWKALRENDPRTNGYGIFPLRNDPEP